MEAKGGGATYSSQDLNPGRMASEPVHIITKLYNIPGTSLGTIEIELLFPWRQGRQITKGIKSNKWIR